MTQDDSAVDQLFAGKGEMAALMRAGTDPQSGSHDWSQTPLGNPATWAQSLRSTLSICLSSRFPIAIYWGTDSVLLYNDAWRPIVGDKHPWALGRPGREVWAEIWDTIGPELANVVATGDGIFHNDELLSMHRFGYTEECFFDYTFNPIQGEGGVVDGVFNVVSETTYRVLSDRRAQLLREVASRTGMAKTTEDACSLMIEAFRSDPADIPLALLYLIDDAENQARLCGSTEFNPDDFISPAAIDLAIGDRWSIAHTARTAQVQEINDLVSRVGVLPSSPWAEPPQEAMILPIVPTGQSKVTGVLVAVASPRRRLDDNYRNFFVQVAGQISIGFANANAYEEERKRAEALAELDRAKTAFFSNVSHEFRTPLTLILSPLEEALANLESATPASLKEPLELMQRNGLRLQKLVNVLLDFSRLEAGRVQACFEPTDLASYTAELASTFRSLIERAGMTLVVDCPPLPTAVYVDQEMWEKIILNLMSNAFKFTLAGSITVRLHARDRTVELSISDTGVGIPAAALPQLFERFHRVENSQGRSFEGSGIGLSLVQELVKLHHGTIQVSSRVNHGTTFTIALPLGTAHLPPAQIQSTRTLASTALKAATFVEEATRWLPGASESGDEWMSEHRTETASLHSPIDALTHRPKILLADDNADMRDYVQRLLSSQFDVTTATNGAIALAMVQTNPPDLVLTDVMMPEMDGFELLRSLRSNPTTQNIPIILLSARAGEEARIEGLEAGADDYLIKPFSARELLARVEATLKLTQLRQESQQREQTLQLARETAQAETETVLRRLEQLLESMGDAFVAVDQDWRIIYQNAAAERINAKPRAEVLGKTLWEEWPATVGSIADEQYHYAIAQQESVHFELHYYEPPDHDVWLDVHAYPFEQGLGIFYRDITARKQSETTIQRISTELERQLQKFDAIATSIPDFLYTFDRSGRFTYTNQALLNLLQKTEAEVMGKNFHDLDYPTDVASKLQAQIQQVIERGQALRDETPFTSTIGTRAYEYIFVPLFSQSGNVEAVAGITRDITDRKRIEAEREQLLQHEQTARAAAETANRIKDEFLAVLSHELRSPLNPILGWSKLLQQGKLNTTKTATALATIERNAQLQVQLIDDLLDISRILRGKLSLEETPVDLSRVITAALETVRLAMEAKSLQLHLLFAPDVGVVIGDAGRLQQVIWNLLSNAVKFTPNGGEVTVKLEQAEEGREAGGDRSFSASPPFPTYAQITITDTGKGIAPDFLPYVFDHFRQEDGATTRKFGGLGLGLAIARQIVEMHGGTIAVDSSGEGQGATFTVRLPLATREWATETREQPDQPVPPTPHTPLTGLQILVVDDEVDSREFVVFVLEQEGAIVISAASAIEALQMTEQATFDLVISDIGMPDLDGYGLMRQLRQRKRTQAIPAIALTAYARDFDRQQALQSGFQQHLTKPIEPGDLVQTVVALVQNKV